MFGRLCWEEEGATHVLCAAASLWRLHVVVVAAAAAAARHPALFTVTERMQKFAEMNGSHFFKYILRL